jgi:ABC-type branched-subunit amino acid transport system ATPase component
MQFVGRLCQRVVVLNFGVKIAECPVGEIHADRCVREAYLGTEEHAA